MLIFDAAAATQAGLARSRRHCGDDQGTASGTACPTGSGSRSCHAESAGAGLERFPAAEWCSPGSARRPDVPELCPRGGLRLSRQPSAAWPTDSTAWDGGYPTGPASPYAGAAAMPQSGSSGPYGGNAYATPHPGAPYGPPQQYAPNSNTRRHSNTRRSNTRRSTLAPSSMRQISTAGQMPQQAERCPVWCPRPTSRLPDDTAGDLADQTSVAERSPYLQEWSILLDDGRRIALDGLILLGRNPQPQAGEEDAQLIKIADETRTVSKSHLAVGAGRRWGVCRRPRIDQRLDSVDDQRDVDALQGGRNGPGW